MDNDFQREDQRASSLGIPLAWTVASPQWRTRVHQPRKVVQAPPRWKVEKKIANEESLEHKCKYIAKNNELEQNHPFGARSSTFLLICISTINMIHTKKTLRFLTICQKHVMTQTLNIANSTALLRALWPLHVFGWGGYIYIYIFWTNNQHFEGLEHAAEVILDFSRPIQIFETCGRSICHAVFAFAFGSLTFPCRPCHLTEGWIRPGKLTTVTVAKLTGCLGGQMIAAAVGQRSRSVIEWYI